MVVDPGMRASLVEAGLVDPSTGSFTSEPNFGGEAEGAPYQERPSRVNGVPDPFADEPEQPAELPAQPEQTPVQQPQVLPTEQSPQVNVPSTDPNAALSSQDPGRIGPDNDPVRQQYDQTIAQLEQTAQLAFLAGRSEVDEAGNRLYSDEQLAQTIYRDLNYYKQQAFLGAVMQKMQPVAKRQAAEMIAKEFEVTVDDIIGEESPVTMRTRAKTIADLKRDGRWRDRAEAGVDTAEGSRNFNNSLSESMEKLSPHQKMYVGLARGDY